MGTKVWTGLVFLLWGLLGAKIAVAADLSVVPSINARTEFTSNLNYDFKNPVSDFIFTLAYATQYNYTTETSQLQGVLGLKGMHYFKESSADHIDQNYQINGRYQVAPRWNLSLRSAYIVDSTLQEELTASGLIMSRTPRQSIVLGPAVAYNITERLTATVNYNFNKVNYQSTGFSNHTSQFVGLNLGFPLKNQKTVLQGNIIGREIRYSGGSDLSRSLGINFGVNHMFTENWEFKLLGGVNISFMNFNTQVQDLSQSPFFVTVRTARVQETRVSPSVSLFTTRRWTKLSITGGYIRSQGGSAFGTISDVNSFKLSGRYKFTERLSGTLGANFYLSNQISQSTNYQYDYFSISPQLAYRVTEKLSTAGGYSFSMRDDISGGRTADAHIAWLMLTYSYPIHYQK
jgi:hypothetical protein